MLNDLGTPLPRIACPYCHSDRVARMGVSWNDPHIRCLLPSCRERSNIADAVKAGKKNAPVPNFDAHPIGVQRFGLLEEKPVEKTVEQLTAIEAVTKRLTEALDEKLKLDRYVTIQEVCDLAGFKSYSSLNYPHNAHLKEQLIQHNETHPLVLTIERKRAVVQVDLETGKVIREFESTIAAANEVDRAKQNIADCCKFKKKTCAGFAWRYKDQWSEAEGQRIARQHQNSSRRGRKPGSKMDDRDDGQRILWVATGRIFLTQLEAARASGRSQSYISQQCGRLEGEFQWVDEDGVRAIGDIPGNPGKFTPEQRREMLAKVGIEVG